MADDTLLRGGEQNEPDAFDETPGEAKPRRAVKQSADEPVSREHVLWAYRVLLDREPENDEVVQAWFERELSASELRLGFMSSVEFRLKNRTTSVAMRRNNKGGAISRAAGSGYVAARTALEWVRSRMILRSRSSPAPPTSAGSARFARRPRILLVTPYQVFPPNHGGGVRLYNLIQRLSERVDIYLIVFSTAGEDEKQREALGHYCAELFFHQWEPELSPDRFGVEPPNFQIFRSEEATALIRDTVLEHEIDIVQLEYSELGQYASVVPNGVPVVLTAHDITFRTHQRRLQLGFNQRYPESRSFCGSAADLRRIFLSELAACRAARMVHVMSSEDGRYLARFLADGWRRLRVVPNGVDCDGHAPRSADPDPEGVLFVGYFQNLPNQDALEYLATEVWPEVRRQCPEATLTVVGSGTDARTRRHTGKNGIHLVGEVPHVVPYYRSHRVMVAPIRAGSGTRLKILEAFAAGIPVVSTTLGAEGILAVDGQHLLLADDPGTFADSILRLLNDDDLHQRIAAEAMKLARERYDWDRVVGAMLDSYAELLEDRLERLGTRRRLAGTIEPVWRSAGEPGDERRVLPRDDATRVAAGFDPEPRRPTAHHVAKPGTASIGPRGSVLLLGVYLAHRPNNVHDIVTLIQKTRAFDVEQRWVAFLDQPPSDAVARVTVEVLDRRVPKLEIINSLIAAADLQRYDYVVLCDDDIVLPQDFLDRFLTVQDRLGYRIAQPARTINSFIDLPIVEQHPGLLARQTLFVEQGPVVSFHASTFDFVFPLDLTSPMGWGLENVWSLRATERNMKMGIIDAVPVDHSMRRPVANYSKEEAERGRSKLLESTAHRPTEECFKVIDIVQLEQLVP